MRGKYHAALLRLLQEKTAQKVVTQDSLGVATGKDQKTFSNYLRDASAKAKAAPLDLDEADAALRHIGSSLKLFVDDPANVVTLQQPTTSKTQRQLAALLRDMDDSELQLFVGLARGVRASRRTGKQSKRRRVAD